MTATARAIPKEVFFDFVIQPQSIEQLFKRLYQHPSDSTRQHFMTVNSHLGQQVRAGQMVIITPPNAQQCSAHETDLIDAARLVDKKLASQSADEAKVMAENYALLANVANASGAGYGVAVNYFKQHKLQVEQILKKIETLHVTTYNRNGRLNSTAFFQQRKLLFTQLDNVLKTMVGRGSLGMNIDRNNLKRSLGLSSKSLAHQLKDHPLPISDLPGFEKNHVKVQQYSKVLKGAGYVALALDGVQSTAKIKQACTTGREDECTKSKFSEGGRFAGSVIGGYAGGLVAYKACSIVFAVPSAGTSLLWCGILVGGVGGLVGGNVIGGLLQGGGEVVYEKVYSTK